MAKATARKRVKNTTSTIVASGLIMVYPIVTVKIRNRESK